jgi:hypothetical protein
MMSAVRRQVDNALDVAAVMRHQEESMRRIVTVIARSGVAAITITPAS